MGKNKFSWNFKDDDRCKNDEARSVVINNAVKGTIISFYDRSDFLDSSKGSKHDDYTVITIKKDITDPITIGTFEKSFSNDFVDVKFHKDNFWFPSGFTAVNVGLSPLPSGVDGRVSLTTVDISNIATERFFGNMFG